MAATNGPSGLQTMIDLELSGLSGADVARDAEAQRVRNAQATGARAPTDAVVEGALTVAWADLKERNPGYLREFWEECRALYASGRRLFGNPAVLKRLYPPNPYEDGDVYLERAKRAHYFPYAGTILDHLISGLSSDPLRVSFAETDDETGAQTIPASAEWWAKWIGDVTGDAMQLADSKSDDDDGDDQDGGCSGHEFLLDVVREAMQAQTAWCLCALPDVAGGEDADASTDSQATTDAEADPYYKIVPAEEIIDWQEDKAKNLTWVLTMSERKVRATLKGRRKQIEQTYTLWTRTDWVRYVVIFDPAQPPQDTMQIKPTLWGDHPFKRVPFLRFALPDGIYGMGKLHSLAREHFNKRGAMSWAEYKALYPILYEFNGPEEQNGLPVAQAQTDASRSTSQIRAQGYSQLRGKDDDAKFVGPDPTVFKSARESTGDTMREMHRVMFSMALSSNQDSAALMRSGESKDADYASTEVLLGALGTMIRWFVRQMIALCALGRGDDAPTYAVSGLEHFDAQGVEDAINVAVTMFNGVPLKSAHFVELALTDLYCKYLGDACTQEDRELIREQVQEMMVAEAMAEQMNMETAGGDTSGGGAGGKAEPDDDEEPAGGGGPAPMPIPTKPVPAGLSVSSKRTKSKP